MTASSADSHPGHKRSHNEDCFKSKPERNLWLVADGVGGHANGEVAAAIVRDTVVGDLDTGIDLIASIRHAHEEILREIERRPASNMGSTVVALKTRGNQYEVAWVGDSRAYLFDGDKLRQLTRDHNPVSEMVARGVITPEQAALHPERNVLSQSLGVSGNLEVQPERVCGEFQHGQQFILCSDGLTDEIPDQQICRVMQEQPTPREQVAALIQAALDAGGRDNVTVIVVGAKDHDTGTQSENLQQTLETKAAASGNRVNRSNDRLAWAVLAGLAGLALLWVLLEI